MDDEPKAALRAGIKNFFRLLEIEIQQQNKETLLALINDESNRPFIDEMPPIETIVNYLTDENLKQNPELFNCCEEALKALAHICKKHDMIVSLIDVIDSSENDDTVVSVLKAMQTCLLRPDIDVDAASGPQILEWALNSIESYTGALPYPQALQGGLDDEEEQVIEQDDEVRRIVGFHFYIQYFYKPILVEILKTEPATDDDHFRINSLSSRTVLCCFLFQLFGKPLAYLNFTNPSPSDQPTYTNLYTVNCVKQIAEDIGLLMPDPLSLLKYGERRARWPYVHPDPLDDTTIVKPLSDFYLIDLKAPLPALAVMLYAMLVENMAPATMPKVYNPVYLFEMGLYFVNVLLSNSEETFRTKGLRLGLKFLDNLQDRLLDDDTLELDVQTEFAKNVVRVMGTTAVRQNSENSLQLLRGYIDRFRSTGAKYYLIQTLLKFTENHKIRSILVTMYKNIIAKELMAVDNGSQVEVSPFCKGQKLKELLLDIVCVMPKGVETDILQSNDVIIAALNALIFIGKRDVANHTELWNFIDDIQKNFLNVLDKGLKMTGAHFKHEEDRITKADKVKDDNEPVIEMPQQSYRTMSMENRLTVIRIGQNTFHLIENLLQRLNEIIKERSEGKAVVDLEQKPLADKVIVE